MQQGGFSQVAVGTPVYSQDNEFLGEVKEVQGSAFKVDAPMQRDYWLRLDSVQSTSGGQIVLGVMRDGLDSVTMAGPDETNGDTGRMTEYRATDTDVDRGSSYERPSNTHVGEIQQTGVNTGAMAGGATSAGYDATRTAGHDATRTAGYDTSRTTETHRTDDRHVEDRDSMVLREEQLRARTQPEEAGEVAIRKEVVSQEETVEVPVRREEVVIERRPVSGEVTAGEIGNDREEVRVPVMEEHAELEKRTVAREEVGLGKQVVQDTERLTGTVRREEARVDTSGDVRTSGDASTQRRGMDDRTTDRR
jgi:uncharacterized protein (TIGR02271 family)